MRFEELIDVERRLRPLSAVEDPERPAKGRSYLQIPRVLRH